MIGCKLQRRRWVAVLVTSVLLPAGCTGGQEDHDDGTVATADTSGSPLPTPTTAPAIEFEYRTPEQACPPPAALRLPSAETYPYEVTAPPLDEGGSSLVQICDYALAGMTDEELDSTLDDHVGVFARIRLFRSLTHSDGRGLEDLPLASDELTGWGTAALVNSGSPRVVWEGCAPAMPCENGEEPTLRNHAVTTQINGRAGNLQFEVHITYRAEQLPADVERRNLAIFRDLVLADVARRERVE